MRETTGGLFAVLLLLALCAPEQTGEIAGKIVSAYQSTVAAGHEGDER